MSGEAELGESNPDNAENSRGGLKGWACVEDWMTRLDKGMVTDFNEDINTLLTFAGLFSAVLAGFLVQQYVALQPSDSQTTINILAQISLQMGQMSQQLANNSLVPVEISTPSPSFVGSASIIWINTLWFLSLLLSLAAALFGMIAKQWLREYLSWTTMSGLSEKQVGLRHGRYEAFMEWKTPAIIASMPVLLELALIFFLLGMEILLWTLNPIVFGICTVAVVVLILLVIVVTVLPAFRAQCPYKSPVGWLCVLSKAVLGSFWNRCMDGIASMEWGWIRMWFHLRGRGSALEDQRAYSWGPSPREVHCSFRAKTHYASSAVEKDWRERDLAQQTAKIGGREDPEAAAAAGRHRMLLRSLWWIQENSQDQRLMRAVDECVATFATSNSRNAFGILVADFNFACEHLGIESTVLVPSEDQCADVKQWEPVIHWQEVRFRSGQLEYRISLNGGGQWDMRGLQVDATPSVRLWIAHLLLSDLLAVVARYKKEDVRCFGRQANYILQASAALSSLLTYRAVHDEKCPSVATDRLVELFERLCRDYATLDSRCKPLLPLLLSFLDKCDVWLPRPLLSSSAGDLPRTRHALNIPPGDPDAWNEADCAVFTHISQSALREWSTAHALNTTAALLPPLLSRMTACVYCCRQRQWIDCAVRSRDFFWLLLLSELFDPEYCNFSGRHLPGDLFPHTLIDALQQYNAAHFISDPFKSRRVMDLTKRSAALKAQHSPQAGNGTVSQRSQPSTPSPVRPLSPAVSLSQLPARISTRPQTAHVVNVPQPVDSLTEDPRSSLETPQSGSPSGTNPAVQGSCVSSGAATFEQPQGSHDEEAEPILEDTSTSTSFDNSCTHKTTCTAAPVSGTAIALASGTVTSQIRSPHKETDSPTDGRRSQDGFSEHTTHSSTTARSLNRRHAPSRVPIAYGSSSLPEAECSAPTTHANLTLDLPQLSINPPETETPNVVQLLGIASTSLRERRAESFVTEDVASSSCDGIGSFAAELFRAREDCSYTAGKEENAIQMRNLDTAHAQGDETREGSDIARLDPRPLATPEIISTTQTASPARVVQNPEQGLCGVPSTPHDAGGDLVDTTGLGTISAAIETTENIQEDDETDTHQRADVRRSDIFSQENDLSQESGSQDPAVESNPNTDDERSSRTNAGDDGLLQDTRSESSHFDNGSGWAGHEGCRSEGRWSAVWRGFY